MTDNLPQAFHDAIEAIRASSKESSVYIGCDSIRFKKKRKGKFFIRYSTVIVLHHDSCRGGRIFHNSFSVQDYGKKDALKMRLLEEVRLATEAAIAVVDHLDGRRMEVHLDVNPDEAHASNVAVKEALGWVRGLGFDGKIKPDAWAATHAADHAVRHLGPYHNKQVQQLH